MTALDFYKERLKDRGFSEKQIKDLTDHKDLPWLQFAEDYHTKQLILSGVGSSLISEEEFNTMANDYIKLECNNNEEFNIKAQRFQDYRNGLKNMHKVLK
jgi:hypothetical protein